MDKRPPAFRPKVTVDGAAEGQAFDEIGYTMSSSNIEAESFAGLAWVHLSADLHRKGGVSALGGSSSTEEVAMRPSASPSRLIKAIERYGFVRLHRAQGKSPPKWLHRAISLTLALGSGFPPPMEPPASQNSEVRRV